jgi:hypothetical protein
VYEVAGTPDDVLFTASARPVAVAGKRAGDGARSEVALEVRIRPELLGVVQAQADAALDACAAGADDVVHAGCPFQGRGDMVAYHVGDDVTWRVTRYPRIELRISADPAADGGPIMVRTAVPGEAVATWPGGGETDDVTPGGVVTVGQDGAPRYRD